MTVGESARRSWSIVRRLAAVAVLAAVLSPAITNHDSFPLSTYPMYAFRRGRLDTFQVVLGVDAAGADRPLSLWVVANTDDPLIGEILLSGRRDLNPRPPAPKAGALPLRHSPFTNCCQLIGPP